MARFEYTINVQRPIEQVFAFLANGENNHRWELEIVESRQLTDGPTRVGTRWLLVRQFLGIKIKGISEVVEYEPNRKLVKKSPDGPMPGTSTILFEPANGGTKLHFTVNFETKGFLKLLDPLLEKMLVPQGRTNLRKLKEILEG
jgi:uncharacterized membrane protein